MASITLHHVSVDRGGVPVLHDVSFTVADGEVVAVVGRSGAGKSTLLRAIAGLERLTAGHVALDGTDVTALPANQRGLAMVSETASLLPHRAVSETIAFPLRLRRVARPERDQRVQAEARAMRIRRLLGRRPRQLSAGERQAVAAARGLVRRPRAILMDEPLTRLDEPSRVRAMRQIEMVQAGYGVAMLLATNDSTVAASLASRLVVVDAGHVVQIGPFQDLYDHPTHVTVAELLGELPINLVGLPGAAALVAYAAPGLARAGVRPEHLDITRPGEPGTVAGAVRHTAFAGATVLSYVEAAGSELLVASTPPGPAAGDRVGLRPRRVHQFDATGIVIDGTSG